MSTPTSGRGGRPPTNAAMAGLRGGVDLGQLAAAREAQAAAEKRAAQRAESGDALPVVVDVTKDTFQTEVMDRSMSVPVLIDLWADWCGPCKQLSPILEKLAADDAGKWVLAKIDIEAEKELGAAFRVQSIPAVFVVIGGQAAPLFQGALPEAEVRKFLDEILKLAASQGLSGPPPEAAETASEPEEVAADPRYDAAFEAFERSDWDAAAAAYDAILADDPSDLDAQAGKARVILMRSVDGKDATSSIAAADSDVSNVAAAILASDFELLAGNSDAAFARLIATIKATTGDDRDAAKAHLLELFEISGATDPSVVKARSALASALF